MNMMEIKYFKEQQKEEDNIPIYDIYFKKLMFPDGKEKEIEELCFHPNLGYMHFNYENTTLDPNEIRIDLCSHWTEKNIDKESRYCVCMYSHSIEVINDATNYFKKKYDFLIEEPTISKKWRFRSLLEETREILKMSIRREGKTERLMFKNVDISIDGESITIDGKLEDQEPKLFLSLPRGSVRGSCLFFEFERLKFERLNPHTTNFYIYLCGDMQEDSDLCPDCGKEYHKMIRETYDTRNTKKNPTLKNFFRTGERYLLLWYNICSCGCRWYDGYGRM